MKLKKQLITLAFASLVSLSLTACSSQSANQNANDQQSSEQKSEVIQETEGDYTVNIDKKGLALTQAQGPVKYTVNNMRISTFKPNEVFKKSYKGKDVLTCIELDFEMENTGSDTMSILPMTAKLLLDDKTQIDQDTLKSDSMYSELAANAKIQGKYVFYVPNETAPKHFKLFCKGPVLFNDEVGAKEFENYELDININ